MSAMLSIGSGSAAAEESESWWRRMMIDAEDQMPDASAFLETAYGFVPLGTIITDPTVGYGGGLGFLFIQPTSVQGERSFRPDLSGVMGFGTDNGSWGAGAADSRLWREGRLKTLAAGFYASVNLQFFPEEGTEVDRPQAYHLETYGAIAEGHWRIGSSRTSVGLRVTYADVTTSLESSDAVGAIPGLGQNLLSALAPIVTFDSRDNFFTPTGGLYAQGSLSVFSSAFGGDTDFQLLSLSGMWYTRLSSQLTLGIKADVSATFDRAPFYLRPYVELRGIQALKLQDEDLAQAELELRWQPWKRFSLVAFGGAGVVWRGLEDPQRERTAVTGGAGMRYLAARRFGLHMGFDVGFGPGEPILYFQFGSAWFRP
jgi:hypothetical protein